MDALFRWILRGLLSFSRLFKRGAPHYATVLEGYLAARSMMVGVELGLFAALEESPLSEAAIIDRYGLDADGARILLDACVNQNLIGLSGDRYKLRGSFRRWLNSPGVRDDVLHGRLIYDDVGELSRCVRGDWPEDSKVRRFWGGNYQDPTAEESIAYTNHMQRTVERSAAFVVKAAPFAKLPDLLEVGGSSGTLAIAMAEAHPKMRVGILDLAAVEPQALERIEAAGLSDRITFIEGNFLERPLPTDWTSMLLHRVLWDWPDEPAAVLLGRIFTALPSGGRLMVAEGMWTGDRKADVVFNNFHLYMCLGGFRLRDRAQVATLLKAAGFAQVEEVAVLPVMMPMLVGTKP